MYTLSIVFFSFFTALLPDLSIFETDLYIYRPSTLIYNIYKAIYNACKEESQYERF